MIANNCWMKFEVHRTAFLLILSQKARDWRMMPVIFWARLVSTASCWRCLVCCGMSIATMPRSCRC